MEHNYNVKINDLKNQLRWQESKNIKQQVQMDKALTQEDRIKSFFHQKDECLLMG